MKPRGARLRSVVIALSSCLAACASLLGVDEDHCPRGTEGCGEAPPMTSQGPLQPPPPGSSAAPPDASTPPDGPPPVTPPAPGTPDAAPSDVEPPSECDRYCGAITTKCLGSDADYKSLPDDPVGLDECRALCPHFVPASDTSSNTLQCRLNIIEGRVGETSDCRAAGRGGFDRCSTYCEAYCQLMDSICPVSHDLMTTTESCTSLCGRLIDTLDYDPVATERQTGTVQCRLWHLGRAAIEGIADDGRANVHCAHAAGAVPCGLPPSPPAPLDAGVP